MCVWPEVPKMEPQTRNASLRAIDAAHYWNLITKRLLHRWSHIVMAFLRLYSPRAMALLPPVPDDGDP